MTRALATQALTLVISVALAFLVGGLVQWFLGADPSTAFLAESTQLLFTYMDVGLGVWVVLLVVGAVRRRGLGWTTFGTMVAAGIAATLNLLVVIVVAYIQSGAESSAIALGIEAGVIFVFAATLTALIVSRMKRPPVTN
jgi:hypothetical protein